MRNTCFEIRQRKLIKWVFLINAISVSGAFNCYRRNKLKSYVTHRNAVKHFQPLNVVEKLGVSIQLRDVSKYRYDLEKLNTILKTHIQWIPLTDDNVLGYLYAAHRMRFMFPCGSHCTLKFHASKSISKYTSGPFSQRWK